MRQTTPYATRGKIGADTNFRQRYNSGVGQMKSFFAELKRRSVFKVAVAYAVVSWLLAQVVTAIEEPLSLPPWFDTGIIVLLLIGLPVALILAWAFELTPEGVKKTEEVDRAQSIAASTGQRLNYTITAALVAALGYFIWESRFSGPDIGDSDQVTGVATDKAIAVLPFINISADLEQEFFSDGISEELLNVLARVNGLRVTSRTSAFAFKGTSLSIPEVAAQLGVQYVLEGSVRRGSGQVRITTQLIDVETDSHLWSETYDREISDIFAVQDEIAGRVAQALKVRLLGADDQPIAPIPETSIDVYLDVLRARQQIAEFSSFESLQEGERLIESVIASDAAFAPAYVALAEVYLVMTETGMLSVAELLQKARPAVDTALALDDRLADAWLADAWLATLEDKAEHSTISRRRAYALEPNSPNVLRYRILRSYWERRPTGVTQAIDYLTAIDPFSGQTIIALNNWYSRQELNAKVRGIRERMPKALEQLGGALSWYTPLPEEDNTAAIEGMRRLIAIDPADPEGPALLALLLMDAGETEDVERLIRKGRSLDENHLTVAMVEALYMSYRGSSAEALRIAEKLARPRSPTRFGSREVSLRMLAGQALASSSNVDEVRSLIRLYESAYRGLAQSDLTSVYVWPAIYVKWAHLMAALDLAALYDAAGEGKRSGALLDAVAAELPFWPRRGVIGIGIADAELHALRGDDAAALAALRQAAAEGWTDKWWWFLDHSPHFELLRNTAEFAAIRADFAARAAVPTASSG